MRSPLVLLLLLLALGLAASASADAPGWRRTALPLRFEEGGAVALGSAAGSWAAGAGDTLFVADAGGRQRLAFPRGILRDLAWASDGTLWLAGDLGLFARDAAGGMSDRTPAPGAEIARLVVGHPTLAVLGAQALHLSREGRVWQRATAGLPSRRWVAGLWEPRAGSSAAPHGAPVAPAKAAAEREALIVVSGHELWRIPVVAGAGGALHGEAARLVHPAPGETTLDLAAGPEASLALLTERALYTRSKPGGSWRRDALTLPPGARPQRVAFARSWWLATDGGLFQATSSAGPWRRAPGAVGREPVRDLATDGERVAALTAAALHVRAVAAGPRSAAPVTAPSVEIADLHRAAVRYLELGAARMRALRAGVARRGWLPQVDLRVFGGRGRSRGKKFDEAFASGLVRQLRDWDLERSEDYGGQLELSWDLGDLAYHPESIDVSRETRELLELRDAVLDEITQLYFERLRALDRAAAAPDPAARRNERLRAAELAAGIDAWTGGWFGRQLAAASASASPTGPGRMETP